MTLKEEVKRVRKRYEGGWVEELENIEIIDLDAGKFTDNIIFAILGHNEEDHPPGKEGKCTIEWYCDGTFLFYRRSE